MKKQAKEEIKTKLTSDDLIEKIIDFQEKTKRNIFFVKIGNECFIYKAIGRKTYREIINDENYNDYDKEDLICQECTLYPEKYDFENCEAGIPSLLANKILEDSLMLEENSFSNALNYHREQLNDLDLQVSCTIHEAFPEFSIEDIEDWDIETTAKYMSKSEWILHHLRQVPFAENQQKNQAPDYLSQSQKPPAFSKKEAKSEKKEKMANETVATNNKKREVLTPEKLLELETKFPEINWRNDDGARGIDGLLDQGRISTINPALETFSEK